MSHAVAHRLAVLAFAASSALACAAHAAPVITFGGIGDAGSALRTAVAGATTVDFDGVGATHTLPVSFGDATYTALSGGGGNLFTGSISGITAAPGLSNASAYLAVPSTAQADASGSVRITFGGTDYAYFGLFWGSIDAYNTIAFYDDGALLWSGNGSSIAAPANGCITCAGTNRYVNFDFGAQRFDTIVLASAGRAFESDNHAYGIARASVPVPGALALLGIGMFAAGLVRRRAA